MKYCKVLNERTCVYVCIVYSCCVDGKLMAYNIPMLVLVSQERTSSNLFVCIECSRQQTINKLTSFTIPTIYLRVHFIENPNRISFARLHLISRTFQSQKYNNNTNLIVQNSALYIRFCRPLLLRILIHHFIGSFHRIVSKQVYIIKYRD